MRRIQSERFGPGNKSPAVSNWIVEEFLIATLSTKVWFKFRGTSKIWYHVSELTTLREAGHWKEDTVAGERRMRE